MVTCGEWALKIGKESKQVFLVVIKAPLSTYFWDLLFKTNDVVS